MKRAAVERRSAEEEKENGRSENDVMNKEPPAKKTAAEVSRELEEERQRSAEQQAHSEVLEKKFDEVSKELEEERKRSAEQAQEISKLKRQLEKEQHRSTELSENSELIKGQFLQLTQQLQQSIESIEETRRKKAKVSDLTDELEESQLRAAQQRAEDSAKVDELTSQLEKERQKSADLQETLVHFAELEKNRADAAQEQPLVMEDDGAAVEPQNEPIAMRWEVANWLEKDSDDDEFEEEINELLNRFNRDPVVFLPEHHMADDAQEHAHAMGDDGAAVEPQNEPEDAPAVDQIWLDENEGRQEMSIRTRPTEEQIAQAQELREQDQSDPAPTRFSRACLVCATEDPRKRAVFTQCGHIICYPCAVDNARSDATDGRCVFCRSTGEFVIMFEVEHDRDVNNDAVNE